MRSRRLIPVPFLILAAACFLVPWLIGRMEGKRKPVAAGFRFPLAELAMLDRDLQARFAVVPTHDFGIERVTGNQHELYVPENAQEQETVRRLKQKRIQAAFYLMSRQLWTGGWDGAYFKP